MVCPQTSLLRIKKKPEANHLSKTEVICFRFCPHGGNNPSILLIVDYLAKKNLTSPCEWQHQVLPAYAVTIQSF